MWGRTKQARKPGREGGHSPVQAWRGPIGVLHPPRLGNPSTNKVGSEGRSTKQMLEGCNSLNVPAQTEGLNWGEWGEPRESSSGHH